MPGVRRGVAGAILALSLATGCGAQPAQGPGQIVYAVDSGQGSKYAGLFVVDSDGGGHRRLTRAPDPLAITVAWSPAGDELLVEGQTQTGGEIWLMNSDGTGARNVAEGFSASWSRDGSRIALVNLKGGISILSADGSPDAEIDLGLDEGETPELAPDWSPDGDELVLSVSSLNVSASRLVGVRADGKGRPRPLGQAHEGVSEEHATWSPDASMIAFHRVYEEAESSIWVMRAHGSGRRLVVRDANAGPPVWSPDGRALLCEVTDPHDEHVAAYPLAGGTPQRLGPFRSGLHESRGRFRHRLGRDVSWRRDGTLVAYVDDAGQVIVSRPDGSAKKQLTGPKEVSMPEWSPDGGEIAFVRGDDGDSEVFVVEADGENERLVIAGSGPRWSPDGTELLVDEVHRKEGGFSMVGVASLRPRYFAGLDPAWSLDGSRIVFVRHRWNEEGTPVTSTLYTMRRDGMGLRAVAETGDDAPLVFRSPEWLPDGGSIMVGEHDPLQGPAGRLLEVRANGSGARVIARDHGASFDIAVAPDGEQAAFVAADGDRIETIDLQTGRRRTVASAQQGYLWAPRWSPDGEWLGYVASSDETVADLFVVRADGTDRRRLSRPPEPAGEFDWRPS
jgi:Tol biopolymer transport system component